MFDAPACDPPPPAPVPRDAGVIEAWADALAGLDPSAADAHLVDMISALERLKSAAAAAQAVLTESFDRSQRAAQREAGLPERRVGTGIASQVGLARRESPVRGAQHLGLAQVLVREMPFTLAALRRGRICEFAATLLVRETACLSLEHRQQIDRELADKLGGLGVKRLVQEARRLAARLDPASVVRRAQQAVEDRRVTLRPAPDTMTYLTALLPVADGVAAYAALRREAESARAVGDPRTRGQVMADALLERVTGRVAGTSDVEVQLVMTDRALLGADPEPGWLSAPGVPPVSMPAALARELAAAALARARLFVRRLYAEPAGGSLVAMDSRRRLAPRALRLFIDLRDQVCRTPWCDAPVRHRDHVVGYADGGATTGDNLQGLCEACNHAKEAPGWSAQTRAGPTHTVETVTPTGHRHRSVAPPMPGHQPSQIRMDVVFAEVRLVA